MKLRGKKKASNEDENPCDENKKTEISPYFSDTELKALPVRDKDNENDDIKPSCSQTNTHLSYLHSLNEKVTNLSDSGSDSDDEQNQSTKPFTNIKNDENIDESVTGTVGFKLKSPIKEKLSGFKHTSSVEKLKSVKSEILKNPITHARKNDESANVNTIKEETFTSESIGEGKGDDIESSEISKNDIEEDTLKTKSKNKKRGNIKGVDAGKKNTPQPSSKDVSKQKLNENEVITELSSTKDENAFESKMNEGKITQSQSKDYTKSKKKDGKISSKDASKSKVKEGKITNNPSTQSENVGSKTKIDKREILDSDQTVVKKKASQDKKQTTKTTESDFTVVTKKKPQNKKQTTYSDHTIVKKKESQNKNPKSKIDCDISKTSDKIEKKNIENVPGDKKSKIAKTELDKFKTSKEVSKQKSSKHNYNDRPKKLAKVDDEGSFDSELDASKKRKLSRSSYEKSDALNLAKKLCMKKEIDSNKPKQRVSKNEGKARCVSVSKSKVPKPKEKSSTKLKGQKSEPSRTLEKSPFSSPVKKSPFKSPAKNVSLYENDSGSGSDWEEVDEIPEKSQIPDGPIQITVADPSVFGMKKKKPVSIEDHFKRMWNRYQKETRTDMHKVNLLCLLSHGMHMSSLCHAETLRCQALSHIPERFWSIHTKKFGLEHVTKCVSWFRLTFRIVSDGFGDEGAEITEESLSQNFSSKTVPNDKSYCMLFNTVLRCLGLDVRLIFSCHPLPLKAPTPKLPKKQKSKSNQNDSQVPSTSSTTKIDSCSKCNDKRSSSNQPSKKGQSKSGSKRKSTEKEKTKSKSKSRRKSAKNETDAISISSGSDSDFDLDEKSFRSPKPQSIRKRGKVVSTDSSDGTEVVKSSIKVKGRDFWTEVYSEVENRWLPVDCVHGFIDKPAEIEKKATQPIEYVFSFDNKNRIRDLTQRYSSTTPAELKQLRVDNDWIKETLYDYKPKNKHRIKAEDAQIRLQMLDKPLPTSVNEFKNHPLYVLKRHLLKYEAIYPENVAPCGFIKGDPIYPRDHVHVLHTRENWLKEARLIRVGETPYKFVKSRKPKKNFGTDTSEESAPLFGYWQTEDYIPPPAVDGKIPRNEYGNVELFKPSMLPGGTVHLRLPGLNKIAKKLDVDCVAAMTGWDFHGGRAHAVLDGFVVCIEHQDALICAWDEEQDKIKEKEREKKEKRALANWKTLIRGLLIRERLRVKYDVKLDQVS